MKQSKELTERTRASDDILMTSLNCYSDLENIYCALTSNKMMVALSPLLTSVVAIFS